MKAHSVLMILRFLATICLLITSIGNTGTLRSGNNIAVIQWSDISAVGQDDNTTVQNETVLNSTLVQRHDKTYTFQEKSLVESKVQAANSNFSPPILSQQADENQQVLQSTASPPIPRYYVKVNESDSIYTKGWDLAPIVIRSHKLVFFTIPKVGCSIWKRLFMRMMHRKDWMTIEDPHNPYRNGLRYLPDYSLAQATHIMNSPNWTRAMFVRDPKERFLSAYLDKAVAHDGRHVQEKCCLDWSCTWNASHSLEGFYGVTEWCDESHWTPQSERMEAKYFPQLDFVGHMENNTQDARALLQRIGAWEEYGKTGWGKDGKEFLFESKSLIPHARGAGSRLAKYYNPDLERRVEARYAEDYNMPKLGFVRHNITYDD
jgi:hypothetical protein